MRRFKKTVLETFLKIKNEKFNQFLPRRIPIYDTEGNLLAYLRPVTKSIVRNLREIGLIAKWRQENSFAFPTQFKVTKEGTKNWLQNQLIKNPTRILFFIESIDARARLVGHIGLFTFNFRENSCEIDNVVRGDKKHLKGAMTLGLNTIINWTIIHLRPKKIFLKVFSDNTHAINFYKKNGFVKYNLIPLKKIIKPGMVIWKEVKKIEKPDRYFLKMVYKLL